MKTRILQITAGQGPAECCWVVAKVLKMITSEAKGKGIAYDIIDREKGSENGTLLSATIMLKTGPVDSFLQNWIGTVQWIGQSKYRKFHKRKNWFVGVSLLEGISDKAVIKDSEVTYEFTRAGGPGGQHVNKVSTAVRAKHMPTGMTVFVSNGRSQIQNKKEAKQQLAELVGKKHIEDLKKTLKDKWLRNKSLKRGNPIRVFKGEDFKPNHKKNYKTSRRADKQKINRELDD